MNAPAIIPVRAQSYEEMREQRIEESRAVAPYSTMEALRVSAEVGAMNALLDPRYKAWWTKRFGNGPVVRRGFDEANVHPDDPCQSKGFRS